MENYVWHDKTWPHTVCVLSTLQCEGERTQTVQFTQSCWTNKGCFTVSKCLLAVCAYVCACVCVWIVTDRGDSEGRRKRRGCVWQSDRYKDKALHSTHTHAHTHCKQCSTVAVQNKQKINQIKTHFLACMRTQKSTVFVIVGHHHVRWWSRFSMQIFRLCTIWMSTFK